MDLKDYELLSISLDELLVKLCSPSIRYNGIAVSTKSQKDLEYLSEVIVDKAEGYDLWHELNTQSPSLPCSRSLYLKNAFEKSRKGLIIISPDEWMFDWADLDKRSFWSALSEIYGRHPVITLFAEAFENKKFVSDYFYVDSMTGLPVNVWTSKYQQ